MPIKEELVQPLCGMASGGGAIEGFMIGAGISLMVSSFWMWIVRERREKERSEAIAYDRMRRHVGAPKDER